MSLISFLVSVVIPGLLCVSLLRSFVERLKTKRRHAPYPPGPKPKPLIGNLLDLPVNEPGVEYMKWSKTYNSDILFATALGNDILIVNKQKDADELFERRARIYSDRPKIPIIDIMGWNGMISLLPYGNYWRLCRKISQQHFNYESAKRYRPVMLEKVHKMLEALLKTPNERDYHNSMLSVSITMSTMYGYDVKSIHDPMISAAETAVTTGLNVIAPGGSLINIIPFLRHIPPWLAGPLTSRKAAAETLQKTKFMQESMAKFVKESIRNGTAVSSLVTDFMEKHIETRASEEEERAISDVAFTTYAGATDTTISATSTFFYLMAKHPEIQAKAQAEIDRVIGTSRLPEFEDRESLPYLEAIYREVMRWQQSLPLTPHSLTEDDYYKGYYIPKGTTVIANIWAMSHDEDVYSDPYIFKPERFFDKDGNLDNNSRVLSYGFGRRICVGKHIASSVLWLMMASVLTCFKLGKARDEFGNEIEINDEYDATGYVSHKKDFKCSIVPRAEIYKELIAEKTGSY